MRLQVPSLALLSGLRIQHCRELWCRLQTWLRSRGAVGLVQASGYSSDWTPGRGTSICRRSGPRKGKKPKEGGGGEQKKSENQGRKNMGKSVLGAWVCEFTRNASPDPWPATFGVSINLTLHSPAHPGGAALPCPAHVRPGSSRDGFAPEGDGAKSLSLR